MKNRIWIIAAALVCLLASASAGGDAQPTNSLPLCYQYPVAGACMVYADDLSVPIPVYGGPDTGGEVIDYVFPMQPVHVDRILRSDGMAYIYYHGNPEETGWIFDDDCPKGWIEGRFTTYYSLWELVWVVTTDRPGNRLNLRTDSSKQSLSLGKYYAGTVVWQREPPENGYMQVRIGQMIGYMDTRYLQRGMYTQDAELPVLTVTGGEGAQIRKMPQYNSEIIQFAPCGATVTVLAVRADRWVQVMYENEIGYLLSETLSETLRY